MHLDIQCVKTCCHKFSTVGVHLRLCFVKEVEQSTNIFSKSLLNKNTLLFSKIQRRDVESPVEVDPVLRPTASEALQHPFLRTLPFKGKMELSKYRKNV